MLRARFGPMIASTALGALLFSAGGSVRADDLPAHLALSIETPIAGAAIGDPLGLALVSGRVTAPGPGSAGLDLLLAVDTSHSTARSETLQPRGWRRWLGWLLPLRRSAPAPASALSAEIAQALDLLARLDPRTTRVGVVAFAGDLDPLTPDAWVAAPLGDLDAARRALSMLLRHGPRGATNLVDALERGRSELLGEPGAESRARPGARRALLLLTDGVDVHPLHPEPQEARALLRRATSRVLDAGVRVDAIALGPSASGAALEGIADAGGRSLGAATALSVPDYGEGAEVAVRNASSGVEQPAASLPDGRFAALVPLKPGLNHLEIHARSRSGLSAHSELQVHWSPTAPASLTPADLLSVRGDLLAARLRALYARRGVERRLEIEPLPLGR